MTILFVVSLAHKSAGVRFVSLRQQQQHLVLLIHTLETAGRRLDEASAMATGECHQQ